MEQKHDLSVLVSIKEFSDFTGIKQSVLRYYDDIGLFRPVRRGDNNYRYYSLDQIKTIKLIDMLRELNIPLKKIDELMENRTPDTMIDVLINHEVELTSQLRALQESFSLIHSLRTLIQTGASYDEQRFLTRFEEEQRIALGPQNDFRPNEPYHRTYSNYYKAARNMRVNLGYHVGGSFDTFEEFMLTPGQPKYYFSLDPNGIDVKPAGTYLTGYTRGNYGMLNDLPERMKAYIEENKIRTIGGVYHIYPLNEICIKDPNQYLSQVSVRIARGNE